MYTYFYPSFIKYFFYSIFSPIKAVFISFPGNSEGFIFVFIKICIPEMGKLYDKLMQDVRFEEGLKACMNCGVCTAICPAAEFYNYDPRQITDLVQTRDDEIITDLLKSETIWYCGQCMSCKTRCPRGNTPGLIIMALRALSQDLGYFTESEKGRQQYAIVKTIGKNILEYGYCIHPDRLNPVAHPEQGPVWEWVFNNKSEVYMRLGGNYKGNGPGIFRKISPETLDEVKKIFDVTGGLDRYEKIRKYSEQYANANKIDISDDHNDYFEMVYTESHVEHTK
jgi:heterodisulfide reductase subunit C1